MIHIAGYQIHEQIYESLNSSVYRGQRERDGQAVILKVLKENYPSPEERFRYQQEYEITCSLKLDGVIRAYSLEKYHNTLLMVLEDFGGQALNLFLKARQHLTLAEFLSIAIKITESLAQIHAANIIHKDINPSTIVLNATTGQLKLIDFGIATKLSRENPTVRHPNVLEGTLAYMSPEQTGRMNRSLDYRTDFYSLGVTLYELLTHQLPFESEDALELVHCHLAKLPMPPCELGSSPGVQNLDFAVGEAAHEPTPGPSQEGIGGIEDSAAKSRFCTPQVTPQVLSDIVMKLMAKTAEERYQSAVGLKADLQRCLDSLNSRGTIESFAIGEHDVSSRFQIPEKLYGRELETKTLMQTFEWVSVGRTELLLVTGYAGVGKSSLVHEVHKPITKKRGSFIAGKFDQFQRDVPYSAFIQAFQTFVSLLFTEEDDVLAAWKTTILNAVGNLGKVLTNVIPNLELVIGKQPEISEVGPTQAQNRFNLVFGNFIRAIARQEHPLVLVIDDLQWADSASLSLLKVLMSDQEIPYLLLIGAYREHELGPSHPLSMTLEELKQDQANITTITLHNLSQDHVTDLIGETLLHPEGVARLASLVYEKTRGNAFFVKQLFHVLYDNRLLEFDAVAQCWHWNMAAIQQVGMTDNVVELMAAKVQKLPTTTQQIVTLAACIGNRFDLETLAIIAERTPHETAQTLQQALFEGLIMETGNSKFQIPNSKFQFSHDRVQEAAYSLIPDNEKAPVHLNIGKLLRDKIPQDQQAERVFEIVSQFNAGKNLLDQPEDLIMLAELNLQAGRKAKASSAYQPALQHFTIGIDLLPEESWENHHTQTFALYRERYECEYLTTHFEEAERLSALILAHAKTNLEKAEIYNIGIVQYTVMGKNEEAIRKGRDTLKLLGMELPEHDAQAAIEREFEDIPINLGTRKIADLIHLPMMSNQEHEESIKLLLSLLSPAHHSHPDVWSFIIGRIVNLALKYGNTPEIPAGYAAYGMILGTGLGEYQTGYEFGRLALQLSETFENAAQKCKTFHVFANFINDWRMPVKSSVPFLRQAFRYGLESGELLYAGHALGALTQALFAKGEPLSKVLEHIEKTGDFAKEIKSSPTFEGCRRWWQFILCLQGRTRDTQTFNDHNFDEVQFLENTKDNPGIMHNFYVAKLHALYVYEQYAEALEMAQEAETRVAYNFGSWSAVDQNFYYSLTLSALYPTATEEEQQHYRQKLNTNQQQMKIWSENCLENFRHKYLLVEAEIARIEGRNREAPEYYRKAIEEARNHEFIQNEALGNELLAKFWLTQGEKKLAHVYMTDAHYGYQLWGATGKVTDLKEKYPQLLAKTSAEPGMTAIQAISAVEKTSGIELDFATVMKASQAISGEIVLEKLLTRLMEIVIENAGAENGLLLFEEEGKWVVKAETSPERLLKPFDSPFQSTIINYVARTKSPVVLEDVVREGQFTQDRYILEQQPRSVLCTPLLNQGKLLGILYLENNLTAEAFTPDRLEVLKLLSSQAAISIENASLYNTLGQKVAERTQKLAETIDQLQQEIIEREAAEKALQKYREQLEELVEERTAELTQANEQLQQEITERRHAEQAVRASEQQYRALAENVVDGIAILREGRFVFVNAALCSMLKYPAERLLRITPVELFREQDRELFLTWLQQLMQGSTIPNLQAVCRTGDGQEIWTEEQSREIDWEGKPAILVTVRDITERKLHEFEIEKRREQLQKENIALRSTMKERYKFGEIVGKSTAMQEVYELVAHASATDANVVIYGESGTGKELIAHTIHQLSEHREQTFVPVNCGAIPEDLFESEFFGHRKGAFTGADRDKQGFFDVAHKGTLFLDEVGELSPMMQVKLLRALQNGEYIPVGENAPRHADVRIIAATNKNLADQLRKGVIRKDFFYRINVVTITLPPLRDRREDIPLLVDHFLEHDEAGSGLSEAGKPRLTLPGNILASLYRYDWPGNIRELQNVLQRYATIGRLDLTSTGTDDSALREAIPDTEIEPKGPGLQEALESLEKRLVIKALEQHHWHRGKTAASLGIPRRSLQRKMKKYGLM